MVEAEQLRAGPEGCPQEASGALLSAGCGEVPRLWPWMVFGAHLEWELVPFPETPKSSPSYRLSLCSVGDRAGMGQKLTQNYLFCIWDSL